MWLYFFVIYFCGIWAFSSSRKHLLISLLRLEFVVLVLYFSIFFICVVLITVFLFIFWFFLFARVHWACLFWFLWFVAMVMIIFSLIEFFNVKVPLFFIFLTPLCIFPRFWWLACSLLFFISFVYMFFFPYFFVEVGWGIFLVVIWFLMALFFLVYGFVFLWF
jgi:hypothetical protein